ncbi:type VI secretion system lipoprotein TssJ [Marinomonas posidonica]|uniref:Type VI secretion lipoprotein, VC_A0113 family n=1 Tax=Marinomonas posidonica (strain CECT 7376 / NCIMB 14433 / IVIA-Po-181) TaxID=491952 RepID=F6CWV8_MARPP|nr:type VI secretion system lipoprotein TssJ [Marinomonas posidonica]AEF55520.1 type VI secretion lipoprotein, VC_A0113 family [Marinomonas posidonica IVIA-Po-181]
MLNNKVVSFLLVLVAVVSLSGCGSAQQIFKPTTPADQLTKLTFSLVADDEVNPNFLGGASPIEVQVFELVDDSMFMSADFEEINNDYEEVLKTNFVKSYDYFILPGQFKFIDSFEIQSDTNYIGVVAKFSEPNLSEWKKAVKIINRGRVYHLLMFFNDYEVKLDRVE